ncbi:hypothetical protein B0J15DRAFT_265728 [Fusarium solani]|jgi:hypothetical protein|uniref:Uncharacterized protein n=1 Tax=Fusarium solani TaxID=169388 RepID=A0A9P9HV54_FUSSL|nr:uncharacterized protein B0J15DRAFT_265728 [Fusarium solani]KAH7264185.1 hypothetical protein B0J15DRAFT_265728 [Fusarium solani]
MHGVGRSPSACRLTESNLCRRCNRCSHLLSGTLWCGGVCSVSGVGWFACPLLVRDLSFRRRPRPALTRCFWRQQSNGSPMTLSPLPWKTGERAGAIVSRPSFFGLPFISSRRPSVKVKATSLLSFVVVRMNHLYSMEPHLHDQLQHATTKL